MKLQYFFAGLLVFCSGIILTVYSYRLIRNEKKKYIGLLFLIAGLSMLLFGFIGIVTNELDGINCLLTGMTASFFLKKDKSRHTGVGWTMHINGWIGAIFTIVIGIVRILEDLNLI